MASKEVAVKKYVVRLSGEERARLEAFIGKGKRAAPLLTRARILLKADVSESGDGWSDSRIAEALDASIATVERTRRQLVEEGFDAVLTRKSNPNSAPRRIFDGEAEAKLIALACGPAPAGRARWTLRLLEEKVVELQIVASASDNTIGRTLKKHSQAPSQACLDGAPSSRVWLRLCERFGCGHVFGLLARETNVPLALMLVRMALRPISKTRSLWRLPFLGLPSRIRWFTSLRRRPRCGSPCGENSSCRACSFRPRPDGRHNRRPFVASA